MIGLVVVSHSRALANAVVALASEMVEGGDRPDVVVAAGLDDTTLGTDAAAVAEAINQVDGPEGVLVLVDLGSAVLSADMALEFVEPDTAARVTVSSAPLVEGLVAAMVVAATGASLDAVAAEASRGLAGKQAQLDEAGADTPAQTQEAEPLPEDDEGGREQSSIELQVGNEHGLHARPAARLVALVAGFDAAVTVTNLTGSRGPVDAASVSLVATLNVRQGDRIMVSASGPARTAALEAVAELASRNFGDGWSAPPPREPSLGTQALAAGSGLDVAMGLAIVLSHDVDTSAYEPGSAETEIAAAESAASQARDQLQDMIDAASSVEQADIFGAQLALLADPHVGSRVTELATAGSAATEAWSLTLGAVEQRFGELDDPYQRERAEDVRSVLRRVLSVLVGEPAPAPGDAPGMTKGILVVPELDAATAATLDAAQVDGVITTSGGATGHGVIVASSRGIPIITGVGESVRGLRDGDMVAFDVRDGTVLVRPDDEQQRRISSVIEQRMSERARAQSHAAHPATTRDGTDITVGANVGSLEEARAARAAGADGSGLVRTELLFGQLTEAPSTEEQTEVFVALGAALDGHPITIRTWDVGGDKPLTFLPARREANPFLGVRGLRLMRLVPDLFQQQLQAVWRAARSTAVRVMFPMVSTLDDVEWALAQLRLAGPAVSTSRAAPPLEVGIMMEVPAAATLADQLSARLDFVSIGTNDLTQYVMAAERGNGDVADLADPLQPAVLRTIARMCAAVPKTVEVAMCGGLASEPAAASLLVGLGVRELSVVAPRVPSVKAAVRDTDLTAARSLAKRAVEARSPADVREQLAPSAG